jgi:hypothetical protein
VAVGVLAVSLVFIFRAYAASLRGVRAGMRMQQAMLFAQDKTQELAFLQKLTRDPLTARSGQVRVQQYEYAWEFRPVFDQDLGVVDALVRVRWQEARREEPYEVSLHALLPAAR